ncbi:MAG: hypothetical protein Q7T33_09835 [Dehalococcoidia bacterium]|nr:hypothetical protein [Dehalococcoidia bacterium]
MSLREHYEQLASREIGGYVTNRVHKAAGLFQKHLPGRRRLLDAPNLASWPELLQAHGFDILETTACPAKEGERRTWSWAYTPWFLLDHALTVRPSLGHRMVIAARPKRPTGR